jgi:uncharacterized membrane protein YjgN (DUF898 family)
MSTLDAAVPTAQPSLAARFRLPTGPIQFLGFDKDYWRLWIRGSFLLALTLGIYRFWLTTDTRRFLWSNTEVLGEPLEYTGTARELLIGFLIAVAILIPFYALIFLLTLTQGVIGQLAGVIGFVLATVLGHYAVFRARRYRLTRTVYRGVRFHQTGSGWLYAIMAVLWWTVVILTIGLAYPIAMSRLERYKMRNTWLGNLQGRFEGPAFGLFIRGLFMWLVVVGPLIAALVLFISALDTALLWELASTIDDEAAVDRLLKAHPEVALALAFGLGAIVWSMLAGMLLYPVFQAMVLRWWSSGLRFGDMAASSTLRTGEVYLAYLRYIGWSMLFSTIALLVLTVVGAAAGAALWATGVTGKEWFSNVGAIATAMGAVVIYVALALGCAAIYQVKVRLGLWRAVANSIGLANPATLETISSVGAPASPVGEGLADALHVGGF